MNEAALRSGDYGVSAAARRARIDWSQQSCGDKPKGVKVGSYPQALGKWDLNLPLRCY